jgi:NADH-quinone oxidoreductase subunit M
MLSLITFLPFIGGLIILALPKERKELIRGVAVVSSGLALLVSILAWVKFDAATGGWDSMQLVERFSWIPTFGIQYAVGIDGLSLPMILLTTVLSVVAMIASFGIETRIKEYFFWFLLLETGMLGVFVSLDMFLFYVFWEITLVPMYFLIGIWGGPKREYAAVKFFLYTLAGSVLMLLGILALYFASAPHTFDIVELTRQSSTFVGTRFIWVFLALFVGFAVKVPVFPFHTWLPLAHVEAPTAVSVILAGVLLKMGTYGLLRVSFSILPEATKWFSPYLLGLAVINIVYGAFCAMSQKDMKRMVAYSSVNHMGYCLLGMAAITGTNPAAGLSGAVMQMVTHGIITGSLFLLVGVLYDQAHTRNIDDFGGLGARLPVFAGILTVQAMASLGLPGLAGFVAEFLCYLGAFGLREQLFWVCVSVIGIVVTAAFFLKLIKDVFLGAFNPRWEGVLSEMKTRELITVVPLVALTILIGVYPTFLIQKMGPTLEQLILHVVGK